VGRRREESERGGEESGEKVDLEALGEGVLELGLEEVIVLLEVLAALRVAEDDPLAPDVGDLLSRELASEGTHALEVAVLGRDLDTVLQASDDRGDVEGDGGNDDLRGRERFSEINPFYHFSCHQRPRDSGEM